MSQTVPRVPAEHLVWPVGAYAMALVVFAALPFTMLPLVRAAVVVVLVAIGVPLVALNPRRLQREMRWSRSLARAAVALLAAANVGAIGVVAWLLLAPSTGDPVRLIVAGGQVLVVHVIAFGLVYWDVDRDGPVARRLAAHGPGHADFVFSRDIDRVGHRPGDTRSAARRSWMPSYLDYLRLSAATIVLLPHATTPSSRRARWLTAIEAFAAYALVGVVIVRAVALLLL